MDYLLKYTPSMVMLQLILHFLLFHCDVDSAKPNRTIPRMYRRQKDQQIAEEDMKNFQEATGRVGPDGVKADQAANRLSTWKTKKRKARTRSTPLGMTLEPHCDQIPMNCLHAHLTSKVCAKTVYYEYQTIENFCMLEYINCMEGYEVWQPAYMGECFNLTRIEQYISYPYHDDFFLDQYYVVNDH